MSIGCVRVQNLRKTTERWGRYVLPSFYSPAAGWGVLPIETAASLVTKRNPNYNIPDLGFEEAQGILADLVAKRKGVAGPAKVAPPPAKTPTMEEVRQVLTFHPTLPTEGGPIVAMISPIPWGGYSQGQTPTEMCKGLAANGARVMHVSLDPPTPGDDYPVPEGVYHVHPPQVQWIGLSSAPVPTTKALVSAVKDSAGEEKGTVVLACPVPALTDFAGAMKASGWKVLYHVVDDWASMRPPEGNLPDFWEAAEVGGQTFLGSEVELVRNCCTHLSATSPALVEKYGALVQGKMPPCALVENGYDDSHFPNVVVETPADMAIGSPTVVYWGALRGHWFDMGSVLRLCKSLPGAAVNLIGVPPDDAPQAPNLNYLGFKPNALLHHYGRSADVAILPFLDSFLSASVSPIKVPEYLACGLPVVCAGIPWISTYPGVNVTQPKMMHLRVKEAAEQKKSGKFPTAKVEAFLKTRTWTKRAEELLAVVRE